MVSRTGVGYYTAQLVEHLARHHPDTQFVGYYYNFLGRKPRPSTPVGPNIRYRPIYHFPGPIINLLRRFRIEVPIELLTFIRADFVLYPNFLSQPSLFPTPNATTVHDLTFVDLPEYVAPKNLKDLTRFVPSHIQRANFVIIVSEFGKQRLHDAFGVPLDKILVTPIPPAAPYPPNSEAEQRLLKQLGIPGKYILTLGTIEPRKNLPNMIDAYLQLPEKLQKEYTFVVTGKIGWKCETEVARLAEVKAAGKNIMHLGYVSEDQRAALFRHAELFTWASYYEGFGMPILEAMSYSAPCAISDIAVFREVAQDNALYFDQENPIAIASAWQTLLTDPKAHQKYAVAGKKRADTYQWDTVAKSLYERIVATIAQHNTKRSS